MLRTRCGDTVNSELLSSVSLLVGGLRRAERIDAKEVGLHF